MKPGFVHLHLHTEYSIVDGLISIKPLMQEIAKAEMPAVAITDQANLFAMVKFYKAAIAAGIKPIIGADIWLQNEQDAKKPYHMVLLCQNSQGYKNLTRLISRAYLEGQQNGIPIFRKEWIQELAAGLIALSGGMAGDIGHAIASNQLHVAKQLLQDWMRTFPNRYYLELQRIGRNGEEQYIQQALEFSSTFGVPVVATNDVHFLREDDYEAHEARVCINSGFVLEDHRRPKLYSEQQYLRTPHEMAVLFKDIPEALSNTMEIAKRCNVELSLGKYFLPNFPVPSDMTIEQFFEKEAKEGLEKRLADIFDASDNYFAQKRVEYDERLEREIRIIEKMGFPGYFLIVADFIRWAKAHEIPVGPGRGSGAGSLVAYALSITDLDPIAHDLLFERFLNPERVSMADFDIDFCMEGRDRVIEYVAEKYGRNSVSQIITYGTMAARAVVRDVGRVLGYPYGFVDKLAKLIPFELGMTLEKAMHDEQQLQQRYDAEIEVKTLIDLALKLEGVPRNVGKHAGGVVIAPSVLTDFTPLYCEAGGENRVTQFDKDDVEAVGLVKFDFLGLRTLTIIDWAIRAINQRLQSENKPTLNINRLALDDPLTFNLLKACDTTAVFQLESRGMKDLIKRLQPDNFDDIVALVALFRPGPLQSGMVDDYINRKHGRAKVEYPHPALEPILKTTYGVILYQEQVMQIAQVLAGYTLGAADLLRRAMGKKKPEEMAKQRAIFVAGAQSRNVDGAKANQIFDLMEKFADYGFNKSHSAAYALLAYQTAWLKAHYPAEFMAAVLSSDMDNTDKLVRFIEDCRQLQLTIVPPKLNQSNYKFSALNPDTILYGLGAIKGVGEAAVENIIFEREQNGVYQDLFEFCQRVDTRKVNRKVLEALIRSGAMDGFNIHRASLTASSDVALNTAEQHSRNEALGQNDLFGSMATHISKKPAYIAVPEWQENEILMGEKETLGWYVSGHPIARYENELKNFITGPIATMRPQRDKIVTVAGFVSTIRTLHTKSGARMAVLSLEDRTGTIDVMVFSDVFETFREYLIKDQLLIIEGDISLDEFSGGNRMSAQKIYNITKAREKYAKRLLLRLHQHKIERDFIGVLSQKLLPFRGGHCPVHISYQRKNINAELMLGSEWKIKPDEDLIAELSKLCGVEQVLMDYA